MDSHIVNIGYDDSKNDADTVSIMRVLSHRYPMLMIDRVISNDPGHYCKAIKRYSINEYFFRGHYPDNPIVPGTMLLEALSQTAAFAILTEESDVDKEERSAKRNVLFAGVSQLRFLQPVRQGDSVVFQAEIKKNIHGLYIYQGKGFLDDKTCITAEMSFVDMR